MPRHVTSISIGEDLGSLPLPPEATWTRAHRRTRSFAAVLGIGAVGIVVLLVIATPLGAAVRERITVGSGLQPTPSAGITAGPATTAPAPNPTTPSAAIACPSGQTALLDVTRPPTDDIPGTGAANAEEAFRRLGTATPGGYVLTYPFGTRPGAPVWIIAKTTFGADTFIAEVHGTTEGNDWFAYPARFAGCRGQP